MYQWCECRSIQDDARADGRPSCADRRWTHKLFHKADDNGYENTAAVLKEIQGLMDEARALLTDAQDALDKDASSAPGVTVNLV